jgi:hypothetical protein
MRLQPRGGGEKEGKDELKITHRTFAPEVLLTPLSNVSPRWFSPCIEIFLLGHIFVFLNI